MTRFILIIFLLIPNFSLADKINLIGKKGELSEISRTITIRMYDNYYVPAQININKNETIKFIIFNTGELVHEFNIATKKMHIHHQAEMITMVENEILLPNKIDKERMKNLGKNNPTLLHSHSNSVLLSPGEKGELIWKFSNKTMLEFACNVPGHYEVGMIGKINEF
tara:strand:+ start:318 stop:818 length:501 start_codon:yes stop_codon:yes gene_type:complete